MIEIGSKAFLSCSKIEEVKIPHLVAQIGDGAFAACKNLKSIIVDSNNSYYDSREGCNAIIETATNTLIASCKGTTIPNSIVNIGNNAFEENQTLIGAVTIPNSIKRIGKEAFKGCRQMSSLSIPDALIEVGENAFYNTIWYNNATDGFLYWGNCCLGYKGSNDFNTLEIKEGTRIIANNAFANCRNLESIIIPASVIRIGSEAFNGCENLTSIIIPESVTEIGDEAFEDCYSLKKATIGNSVKRIGCKAFHACFNMTEVTIGSSVTEISMGAFEGCKELNSITIPESVAYLGDGVFWRCKDTILVFLYNPDIHAAGVYTFPEDARFLIMGS